MEYFMDKMENWELYELYQTIEYADSNNWEQTRAMMYVIAQVNSKKRLSPEDIMKFPWENKGGSSCRYRIYFSSGKNDRDYLHRPVCFGNL